MSSVVVLKESRLLTKAYNSLIWIKPPGQDKHGPGGFCLMKDISDPVYQRQAIERENRRPLAHETGCGYEEAA